MKRKTLKFMACAAAMALTLSITACGGSNDGASSSTSDSAKVEDTADTEDAAGTEDTEEPKTESETEAEDEAGTDAAEEADSGDEGEYATLEAAFSDPAFKDEFEAELDLESSQGDGMSITYEVSGNEFTYLLKIEDPSLIGDDMAEQLQEALDSDEAASIYQPIAQVLDYVIGQEGACTVTIHYLDPDGEIMAKKSFKAN